VPVRRMHDPVSPRRLGRRGIRFGEKSLHPRQKSVEKEQQEAASGRSG
jgi:hypothetical protein